MFYNKQKEINRLIDRLELTTTALADQIKSNQAEIANWKKKYNELSEKYNYLKENNLQMLSVINSKVPNGLKEIKTAYFASKDYINGQQIKPSELDELITACQQFIIKHPKKDELGKRLASVALLNFQAKDSFPELYRGYLTQIVITTTQNKEVELIAPIELDFVSRWIERNKTASILAMADQDSVGSAYTVENIPAIKLFQIVPVTDELNSPSDRYATISKSNKDFMENLAKVIDYRKEPVIVSIEGQENIQQAHTIWSPEIAADYIQKDLLRIINKDEA